MAAQYESSIDFTEDFADAYKKLTDAVKLLNKPEMLEWMKATDQNYGTACEGKLISLIRYELPHIVYHFDILSNEIDSAV
jgi:hypothetical protein